MTNLKTLLMATVAVFALGASVALAENDARPFTQLAEANQDGTARVIVVENDARPYYQLADANRDAYTQAVA